MIHDVSLVNVSYFRVEIIHMHVEIKIPGKIHQLYSDNSDTMHRATKVAR